ncbi:MAG: hypothetical protein HY747_00300 [Elusimicrobia bacterium]|nr:hypothetical protein [Elusimicrobiota bacterium]
MRKNVNVILKIFAAFLLLAAGTLRQADASESFQFAPPPFPILNLRAIDAQNSGSLDYIGMKIGNFDFKAGNFGFSRMAKKWDNGGMNIGFNYQLITASGKESFGGATAKLNLFGPGLGFGFNFLFDLAGSEEDNFSFPLYFGPHINMSTIFGSMSIKIPYGTKTYSMTVNITANSMFYGWQGGLQMGANLGPLKFIPYLDFSQEMGGSVGTTVSYSAAGYSGSTSTSESVSAMPVAMSPGIDIMVRPWGMSVGAVSQVMQKAGTKKDEEVKTTVVHLRFTKKFRSICGI